MNAKCLPVYVNRDTASGSPHMHSVAPFPCLKAGSAALRTHARGRTPRPTTSLILPAVTPEAAGHFEARWHDLAGKDLASRSCVAVKALESARAIAATITRDARSVRHVRRRASRAGAVSFALLSCSPAHAALGVAAVGDRMAGARHVGDHREVLVVVRDVELRSRTRELNVRLSRGAAGSSRRSEAHVIQATPPKTGRSKRACGLCTWRSTLGK